MTDTQIEPRAELPEPERAAPHSVAQRLALAVEHQSFSGPLPPPDMLLAYNAIHPDFAERILRMTEKEAANRHVVTRRAQWLAAIETGTGQAFGLIVSLAAFGTSAWLGYLGHPAAAATIGSATLVALVRGECDQ